jgi:branched-chain amino acid transport system ATP-binding protein
MLQVEGLVAGYDGAAVLQGVSFSLQAAGIIAVLGPNGAGKTTLLKSILHLTRIHRGRVMFNGRDLAGLQPHQITRLGIALVPEGRRIFPDLTLGENLSLGEAMATRKNCAGFDRKAVLELFPILRKRLDTPGGLLSGGEQQMLAIGRALLSNPTLLMMDEPSLGLAPLVVAEILSVVKKLPEAGASVLLVEQNVGVAARLANRFLFLENGRCVEVKDAAAVTGRLQNAAALRRTPGNFVGVGGERAASGGESNERGH